MNNVKPFSLLQDLELTNKMHADDASLTDKEYAMAVSLLGRSPNKLELGIIGSMWSEHCSYKSSRAHLARLPTEGPHVLQGPGENAASWILAMAGAFVLKWKASITPLLLNPFKVRPLAWAEFCAIFSPWALVPLQP